MRFDFLRSPPAYVGGLIAALGLPLSVLYSPGDIPLMGWAPAPVPPSSTPPPPLSDDITTLGIRFPWDAHHERPLESAAGVAGKQIIEYWISFTRGRADAEAILLDAFGEPTTVHERRRYGLYFVDAHDTDWFALEWYTEEPIWAKPPVDAETQLRQVQEFVAAGQQGRIELSPPMPALACAQALGIVDPVAITTDVHMTSWRLEQPAGGGTVIAYLDGWPSGEQLPGYGQRRLGDGDTVRWIDLVG